MRKGAALAIFGGVAGALVIGLLGSRKGPPVRFIVAATNPAGRTLREPFSDQAKALARVQALQSDPQWWAIELQDPTGKMLNRWGGGVTAPSDAELSN